MADAVVRVGQRHHDVITTAVIEAAEPFIQARIVEAMAAAGKISICLDEKHVGFPLSGGELTIHVGGRPFMLTATPRAKAYPLDARP
jgi:hypothetical protein